MNMKTIQVTDEVYEFLKSCQEELNTQYNRMTANPIFGFQIKEERASHDPEEYVFITDDGTSRITNTERENWEEELAAYIMSQYDDSVDNQFNFLMCTFTDTAWPIKEHFADDEIYEDELKKDLAQYIKNLKYYEYEDFCSNLESIKVVGYGKEWVTYSESFSFFESDIQAHIDSNKHNMKEYRSYVYHNHRTPKMTQLVDILKKGIEL